jgi:hypothetical protein
MDEAAIQASGTDQRSFATTGSTRTEIDASIVRPEETPSRTELGRRLREFRRRIVQSGAPLLNWNALDDELRNRRGDRKDQ